MQSPPPRGADDPGAGNLCGAERTVTDVANRKAAPKKATARDASATGAVSFPQRAGASERETLLFEMARARTAVLAAVQGMVPGSAERPLAEGKWNTRQHVLHLAYCEQVYAPDLLIALRGETPAAASYTKEDDDQMNAEALARMNPMTWDEALRLLHTARLQLLETIETLPVDEVLWTGTHMIARILRSAALHDRHHAEAIKRWRSESNT
jgi:hypothetical protein